MNRSDREARLRDELALHVELETEANVRRGMSPADARRAALMGLGAVEHFKDEARDQFRSPLLASIGEDVRYAVRAARRAKGLTSVAILTLALAFALVTLAFTAVNGVLLRSLPYPEPDRLALIWRTARGASSRDPVSFTNAMDWRRDTRSIASLAMFSCVPRPILAVGGGEPVRASMMDVSADFFGVLAAKPLLGRLLDSTDFVAGGSSVVVLTHSLWRDRFGGDASVIGSRVRLNGAPARVIGVLPADYASLPARLACRPALYRPLDARYDDTQRTWSFLRAIVRLKPGATVERAQAELDVENARLAEAYPMANRGHGAVIVPLAGFMAAPLRPALVFAQIGALLVLLIACANVASLLLARATARRRELSIRVAIGASAGRVARQVGTECLLLGAVSATIGVLSTIATSRGLTRFLGDSLPDPRGISLDWRVISFAIASALVATGIFGLVAVLRTRGDGAWLLSSLRDGGRGTGARPQLTRAVVGAQLAIALIVVVSSGLLARSYRRLQDVRPGFDPDGVTTARVTLPDVGYPRGERQIEFFRQVLDRISEQPGIVAAGGVSILPESPDYDRTAAKVVGRAYAPEEVPIPDVYRVTPGYFAAMRIALKAGRFFSAADDDRHPLVAVINETMARTLFPGETAIGRRLWTGAGNAERAIVGVVEDVYQYGLDSVKTMQLYVSHADNGGGDLTLVIRSARRLYEIEAVVREAVHGIDPGVPVDDAASMRDVLAASAARRRFLALLGLVFAGGAIGLASIGLYGVIAYSTARRTQEIGVRMALGATASSIVRQVIAGAWPMVVAGCATGLFLTLALTRLMRPLLFGVRVTDPVTFAEAVAILIAVSVMASAGPAWRAARLNPTEALRLD